MTNNKTLIEFISESNRVENMLLESQGEITPEIEEILNCITKLPEKVESYSFVQDRLESSAELYKTIAKRYLDASKVLLSAKERLDERLKNIILDNNLPALSGNTVSFSIRKNPPSLIIENEDLIPLKYKNPQIIQNINKPMLKDSLLSGESVLGASIKQSKSLKKTIKKD